MVIPSQIGAGRIFPHFAVANCETVTYLILSKFSAITQLLVMTQLSITRLSEIQLSRTQLWLTQLSINQPSITQLCIAQLYIAPLCKA